MTAGEKLLEGMRANPRDWRIDDVVAVFRSVGVECTPPRKGSHYKVKHASMEDILTIPAHRPTKPVYIRDLQVSGRGQKGRAMKPEDYEVDIRRLSPEDGGGFVAIAPELPGCRSDGETPEEALRNGYDAIACWLEAAKEMGRPIPTPRPIAA